MLRRATLLLLLLPGLALGQTTAGTVTALVTTQSTRGLANRAECASTTSTATWNLVTSLTIGAGDKWRLATVATGTGCTTSGGAPTGIFQDVTATGATQSIPSVPVASMATGAGATCTNPVDQDINICVYYLPGGSTTNWALAAQGTFTFQTAIPPAPIISSSTPGDSQLSVAVSPGNTTSDYQASKSITFTITCTPAAGGTASTGGPGNAGNIVCSGLTNGTSYKITATGFSVAGNQGPVSPEYPAGADTTPLPFTDFWGTYKAVGGVETGGCGTGGIGAIAPALAVLALLATRRRRS